MSINWKKVMLPADVKAAQVSYAARNNKIILTSTGDVVKFNSRGSRWEPVPLPFKVIDASLGCDCVMAVLNPAGECWLLQPCGILTKLAGRTFKKISCGCAAYIVGLGEDRMLYQFQAPNWVSLGGGPWNNGAIGHDGFVAAVATAAEQIFFFEQGQWVQSTMRVRYIDCKSRMSIGGVNGDKAMFLWHGGSWRKVNGTACTISWGADGMIAHSNGIGDVYEADFQPRPAMPYVPVTIANELTQALTAFYAASCADGRITPQEIMMACQAGGYPINIEDATRIQPAVVDGGISQLNFVAQLGKIITEYKMITGIIKPPPSYYQSVGGQVQLGAAAGVGVAAGGVAVAQPGVGVAVGGPQMGAVIAQPGVGVAVGASTGGVAVAAGPAMGGCAVAAGPTMMPGQPGMMGHHGHPHGGPPGQMMGQPQMQPQMMGQPQMQPMGQPQMQPQMMGQPQMQPGMGGVTMQMGGMSVSAGGMGGGMGMGMSMPPPPPQVQWTQMPGKLAFISAGNEQNIWGVGPNGDIFRFVGGQWQQVSGRADHVSVGADGTVWAVTPDSQIYAWNAQSGQWEQRPGQAQCISVGNAQNIWATLKSGDIYKWNGSGWVQVPGKADDLSVGADGFVLGIAKDKSMWRFDNATQSWQAVPGQRLDNVEVKSAQMILGSTEQGDIFQWRAGGWQPVPGKAKQISIGVDGNAFAVTANGDVYRARVPM